MSDADTAMFLAMVKDELGSRLLPAAEPGMHQQVAMCGQRILAHLLTGVRHLPPLREAAMDGYLGLIGSLKSLLTEGDDPHTLATLETQLTGDRDYRKVESTVQQISIQLAGKLDRADALRVLGEIVAIDQKLQSKFIAAYMNEISASTVDATAKDIFSSQQMEQLISWLRNQFPANAEMEISGVKLIPGGFSKQTIFLSLNDAKTLPATVVIRLDWSDSAVGSTVVNEFNIIKTLFEAGVKVPQPFAMEASGTVLGGPFLVLSKAEGSNIGDVFDITGGNKAFALDLARTMAKLHSVPPESFGDAVAGAAESTRERMLRELDNSESAWRSFGDHSVSMGIAFAWLRHHIDLVDGPRALIHRDVGCHNMLVKDDSVTAIVDWETAVIGNPAQDLGYVHASIIQVCDWDEFLAAYAATGAPLPSPEQINYFALWGFVWVSVMLMQARSAFTSGAAPDIRLAYAGTYFLARLQSRLSEKLDTVIGKHNSSGCSF